MKKALRLFNILAFVPLLFSCAPSQDETNIKFLDENDIGIYYCGNLTELFSKAENYSNLVPPAVPESVPDKIGVVIDVNCMRDEITGLFLNNIYSIFTKSTYVYIMFINYGNLSIIANTDFATVMSDYMSAYGDMTLFYKRISTGFIYYSTYRLRGTVSGGEFEEKYFYPIVLDTFVRGIKKDLIQQ